MGCALSKQLLATFIEICAVDVTVWVLAVSYRSLQSRGCQWVQLLPCKLPQKVGGVVARYVCHSLSVCKPVALRAGASSAFLLVQSHQQGVHGVGTSTWHVG